MVKIFIYIFLPQCFFTPPTLTTTKSRNNFPWKSLNHLFISHTSWFCYLREQKGLWPALSSPLLPPDILLSFLSEKYSLIWYVIFGSTLLWCYHWLTFWSGPSVEPKIKWLMVFFFITSCHHHGELQLLHEQPPRFLKMLAIITGSRIMIFSNNYNVHKFLKQLFYTKIVNFLFRFQYIQKGCFSQQPP